MNNSKEFQRDEKKLKRQKRREAVFFIIILSPFIPFVLLLVGFALLAGGVIESGDAEEFFFFQIAPALMKLSIFLVSVIILVGLVFTRQITETLNSSTRFGVPSLFSRILITPVILIPLSFVFPGLIPSWLVSIGKISLIFGFGIWSWHMMVIRFGVSRKKLKIAIIVLALALFVITVLSIGGVIPFVNK